MTDYIKFKLQMDNTISSINASRETIETHGYLKMLEYKAFYSQDPSQIAHFYEQYGGMYDPTNIQTQYFYANIQPNDIVVSSGIAGTISKSKAKLLFHNGMEVEDNDILEGILKENSFQVLASDAAKTESWSGEFAMKLSLDKTVSQYPIIEMVEPTKYKKVMKRNRLLEIQFSETIPSESGDYRFVQRYGKGYIIYELYKKGRFGDKERKISVEELYPELVDFKFNGDFILASVKKNLGGDSDYQGLESKFNAYDQNLTGTNMELVEALPVSYIPDTRMDDRATHLNHYRKNYVTVQGSGGEDAKNMIQTEQTKVYTTDRNSNSDKILGDILAAIGLNKVTLGYSSDIGANASAKARRQIESTSIRTRSAMIKEWQPYLEDLFYLVLAANDIFRSTPAKAEYKFEVIINPYIYDDPTDELEEVVELVKEGIMTIEEARKKLGLELILKS